MTTPDDTDVADMIATTLGFKDIEHAARTARQEMVARVVARAQCDNEALLLYHQTSCRRARRIETEGFRVAAGRDVEAVCFSLEPQQTDVLASYPGALITVRVPITWLAQADFEVNPSWQTVEILQDVPAHYVVHIEYL